MSQASRADLEEIEALAYEVRKLNRYTLFESNVRNVMFVGRSRSGKTTATRVLKDPAYEPEPMCIFADTRDPSFQSFCLSVENDGDREDEAPAETCGAGSENSRFLFNGKTYTFQIIDTPGLKEVVRKGKPAENDKDNKEEKASAKREDDFILNSVANCLKNEVTRLNALVIFVSVQDGLKNDDVDCFIKYCDSFFHPDVPIIICITRAEGKDDIWKDNIKDELKRHPYFGDLLIKKNVDVCFLGAVDGTTRRVSDVKAVEALLNDVCEMRENFLRKLFVAEKQISLLQLPSLEAPTKRIEALLSQQLKAIEKLGQLVDFQTAEAQGMIKEIINTDKQLNNTKILAFISDRNLTSMIETFEALAIDTAKKMPSSVQQRFMNDLRLQLNQMKKQDVYIDTPGLSDVDKRSQAALVKLDGEHFHHVQSGSRIRFWTGELLDAIEFETKGEVPNLKFGGTGGSASQWYDLPLECKFRSGDVVDSVTCSGIRLGGGGGIKDHIIKFEHSKTYKIHIQKYSGLWIVKKVERISP